MTRTRTNTSTPAAVAQYRTLDAAAKISYDPAGKPGAPAVRRLQKIAHLIAAARREAEEIRRNADNPKFPAWRRTNDALNTLLREYGNNPGLASDTQRLRKLKLGPVDAAACARAARAAHPRRENWGDPVPSITQTAVGATFDEAFRYDGRPRHVGFTYYPTVQSVAQISNDGSILCAVIGCTDGNTRAARYVVRAGRGYKFDVNYSGVRLVRLADGADYRPNSDEIRAGRAAIVAALRKRADTKKTAAYCAE